MPALLELIADECRHRGVVVTRAEVSLPGGVYPGEHPGVVGETDGLEVRIRPDLHDGDASWVALHLFGHAAQWATDPAQRDRDLRREPRSSTLDQIAAYEAEAGCFALGVLAHAAPNLGAWYEARARADWRAYAGWLRARGWLREPPDLPEMCARTLVVPPRLFEVGQAFDVSRPGGGR